MKTYSKGESSFKKKKKKTIIVKLLTDVDCDCKTVVWNSRVDP